MRKKDSIQELLGAIYTAASKTKALKPVILDLRKKATYTDFLVIMSGASHRQVKALADHIMESVGKYFGKKPLGVEGTQQGIWILIDYGDIVCHVFLEETRNLYRLENLWHDARRIHLERRKRKSLKKINVSSQHTCHR